MRLLALVLLATACGASAPPRNVEAARKKAATRTYTWAVLPNAPSLIKGKQDDMWFTSARRGFAVSGPANAIYGTNDGGDSWQTLDKRPGTYFRSVLFLNDAHGFVSNLGPIKGTNVTDTNVLYETKDSGASWAPVTSITGPMPAGICNLTKIDATHLVAVGRVMGPAHLMTSSDAGATWTSRDLGDRFKMLIDARFTSPTEGIVVGGSAGETMTATILRTTDGGSTFTTVFTSKVPASMGWKIDFPSANVGYVSIQDSSVGPGTIAKTRDGGKTWTEKTVSATPYGGIGIGFVDESTGWLAADKSTEPAYRTVDGGETWQVEPMLASPINRFRFVDAKTAYASGGKIYKLTVGTTGG